MRKGILFTNMAILFAALAFGGCRSAIPYNPLLIEDSKVPFSRRDINHEPARESINWIPNPTINTGATKNTFGEFMVAVYARAGKNLTLEEAEKMDGDEPDGNSDLDNIIYNTISLSAPPGFNFDSHFKNINEIVRGMPVDIAKKISEGDYSFFDSGTGPLAFIPPIKNGTDIGIYCVGATDGPNTDGMKKAVQNKIKEQIQGKDYSYKTTFNHLLNGAVVGELELHSNPNLEGKVGFFTLRNDSYLPFKDSATLLFPVLLSNGYLKKENWEEGEVIEVSQNDLRLPNYMMDIILAGGAAAIPKYNVSRATAGGATLIYNVFQSLGDDQQLQYMDEVKGGKGIYIPTPMNSFNLVMPIQYMIDEEGIKMIGEEGCSVQETPGYLVGRYYANAKNLTFSKYGSIVIGDPHNGALLALEKIAAAAIFGGIGRAGDEFYDNNRCTSNGGLKGGPGDPHDGATVGGGSNTVHDGVGTGGGLQGDAGL